MASSGIEKGAVLKDVVRCLRTYAALYGSEMFSLWTWDRF